jgi:subtilisin family serine protease
MREKIKILSAALATGLFGWMICLICNPNHIPVPCKGYVEWIAPQVEGRDTVRRVIRVQYRCNELIVRNPSKKKLDSLLALGFRPVDTCSCNPGMILMRSIGADPVGIVENPGSGTKDSSMTLNFVMPTGPIRDIQTDSVEKPQEIPNYPSPGTRNVIKVAIIDTGTDPGHAELQNAMWQNQAFSPGCPGLPIIRYGLDFTNLSTQPNPIDLKGHGTHLGGIVTGYSNPRLFAGLPRVRIELINIKVSYNQNDSIDLFKATCGMHYAVRQGAKVLNLSWGYSTKTIPAVKNGKIDKDFDMPVIMLDALKEARDSGAVIVAAMGNEEIQLSDSVRFWPACFAETWDNVISVGSCSSSGNRSIFSNWSNDPQVMNILAWGEDIISTVPKTIRTITPTSAILSYSTSGYAKATGTSMSAPFISREVAYMMGKRRPRPEDIGTIKAHIMAHKIPGTLAADITSAINNW